MSEVGIQVMEPAEITLPLEVHQLAFTNRSVFPHLVHLESTRWSREEFYILDTIMNSWIFKGVRSSMNESPLFDIDSIHIIDSRRSDTAGIFYPLHRADLMNLTLEYEADALVSLEYYYLEDSINVELYYDGGYYYQAYLGFYTTSVWRIYDLTRDTVFDEYVLQDSSAWYGYGASDEDALRDLPLAVNALRNAAYKVGEQYGYRISPGWIEVPRYYYGVGSKEMRMASRMAVSGDWQAATEAWKEISEDSENEKLAARACFNLALVNEMDDLLIPAIDWAIKSYSIRQASLTKEYIDLLQQRFEDRKKLKDQLPAID